MNTSEGYWFRSDLFDIEAGEDEEINPRIYGRQLAHWLKQKLAQKGYAVEPVINEDWGRCLACIREPIFFWVGCANVMDYEHESHQAPPPSKDKIVWHCFSVAEVPFWRKWLRRIDIKPALTKLDQDLADILRSEPAITLIDEP